MKLRNSIEYWLQPRETSWEKAIIANNFQTGMPNPAESCQHTVDCASPAADPRRRTRFLIDIDGLANLLFRP